MRRRAHPRRLPQDGSCGSGCAVCLHSTLSSSRGAAELGGGRGSWAVMDISLAERPSASGVLRDSPKIPQPRRGTARGASAHQCI